MVVTVARSIPTSQGFSDDRARNLLANMRVPPRMRVCDRARREYGARGCTRSCVCVCPYSVVTSPQHHSRGRGQSRNGLRTIIIITTFSEPSFG
ncbi:hypothetical protein ACI65C_000992 [Semiaphis heraclei]